MPKVWIMDPHLKKLIKIPIIEIGRNMKLTIDTERKIFYWQYKPEFVFSEFVPPLTENTLQQIKRIHSNLLDIEKKTIEEWITDLLPDIASDEINHWIKIANKYHECCRLFSPLTHNQKDAIYKLILKISLNKNICKKEHRQRLSKRMINKIIKMFYNK